MTRNTDGKDQESDGLEQKSKALFDEHLTRLDAATLSRLNQARQTALDELDKPGVRSLRGRWLPLAAAASVSALALAVYLQGGSQMGGEIPDAAVSDLEILLAEDSLELYEELDFYLWLEEADLGEGAEYPEGIG